MTSTTGANEVLKQDRRGRVRVPRERREALLAEFSRSGLSAAEFARMAGIKYPTFANWLQSQRKAQRLAVAPSPEMVVGPMGRNAGLVIELAGGGRLTVHSPAQLGLAAELLNLLTQRQRGC